MNKLFDTFVKFFFACFIFSMVFLTHPAFAYTIEQNNSEQVMLEQIYFADPAPLELGGTNPTSTATPDPALTNPSTLPSLTNPSIPAIPSTTAVNQVAPGSCAVSILTPEEAKKILNLTHEGFDGKQLSDGNVADSNTKKDVKDLGKTELVGRDNDGKTAVKVDAPSVAAPADRFSFLNGKSILGPFGIGLILVDTLRVGLPAESAQTQKSNMMYGEDNLSTRTSGVGFREDLVNSFATIPALGKNLAQLALGDEDANKLKSNYLDLDSNDFSTGDFGQGDLIENSILVNKYEAKNSTTCNNSACTISTYSAFGKYFNSWMTTDMVVFNIGPTMLNASYKFLTKLAKTVGGETLGNKFAFAQKIRQKYLDITSPLSLFGKKRAELFQAISSEEGIFEYLKKPLLVDRALWNSGAKGEVDKLLKPDSPIWKFTPEKRKKFMQAVDLLRAYSHESAESIVASREAFNIATATADAITDPLIRDEAKKLAKIEFGQKAAGIMDDWDDVLNLDYEAWLKDNEDIFSFGGLAIKQNGFPDGQGYVDVATGAPFNLKKMVQTFRDNGDFSAWAKPSAVGQSGTYKVSADGISLQLYKVKPTKIVSENVSLQDLRLHLSKMGASAYSVKLPDGRYIPLNESSVKYIESNPIIAGNVSVFESEYAPDITLTPEDFANRLTHQRSIGRTKTSAANMDDLHNGLVQNEYVSRNYTSLLDKQFAEESNFIKNYLKNPVMGVYKGTLMPIAYWGFKKGFGNEDYSAFILPETWTTMKVTQGVDQIYKDSFIDFFVNEGSDQGDMFKRAFQTIPFVWTKVIELGMNTNDFVKENVSKYSGGWFESSLTRDVVKDVAFYSHNENCVGCSGSLIYKNDKLAFSGFQSGINMQAFLVEATSAEEKIKTGSLLVSYTHHSDISGKSAGVEGDGMNLSSAKSQGLTCQQKLEKYNLGWAGPAAGGVAALGENLVYFAGFGPGLAASLIQQMTIGRELQDCVDDVEGYYIHFYAPPAKDAAKSKSKEAASNEGISGALANMSSKLNEVVSEKTTTDNTTPANPVEKSLDVLKNQFQEFSTKAKEANILQASLELMAPSSGTIVGKDVFYIWFKDTLMPNAYNTKGRMVTTDGNQSVEINYETGELKINGETVLGADKADHTRLITTDNRLPAQVVPVTLNKVSAPNNSSTVFELSSYGELKVLDSTVLDCIQKAILAQSGISYSGDELTQVFGEIKQFSTDKYGNLLAKDGKITLEGTSARMMGGSGSKIIVDGFWEAKLVADLNNNADAGKFSGITFEHGTIVLKPETNELVIWLRQHADAVLNNSDVKGLNANLTSIKDPLTECPLPALNLEAIPFANDELGAKKVENFNTSMNHLGPFTQFTTNKNIYEFYTKLDENTGECKTFFRVRDKETGKILVDEEIVGPIKQDADGTIRFNTADGKEQTLKFDAENGVPKVSYNGGAPETLLSAQGPKGSFWYDPETGQWYPENGLQIPLNQAFKDNGTWLGTDKNGNVVGTSENKMTFNIGQQSASPLALPSMPETVLSLAMFIALFLFLSFGLTRTRMNFKKFKKKN